jgi:thiol:disulfide interchange protein DsbA
MVALSFSTLAFSQEGVTYRTIDNAPPPSEGKVHVVEFFWYGCPHCYELETGLDAWRKAHQDQISFERMPAAFGGLWALHARAYYTAVALGAPESFHQAIFQAIHQQGNHLDSEAKLRDFFVSHGFKGEAFDNTFHSFGINVKLQEATKSAERLGIDGVPTFLVADRYITSPSLVGNEERFFQVMDDLLQRSQVTHSHSHP